MQATAHPDLWQRVLRGTMRPELARWVQRLDFANADHRRMEELSVKANRGTLSDDEREELEEYIEVGHTLAALQAEARAVLNHDGATR